MSGSNPGPSRTGAPDPTALRVIGFALLGGPVIFAVVVGVLHANRTQPAMLDSPAVPLILTAVAAINIVLAFVLRGVMFGRIPGASPDKQAQLYATGSLLFLALLEGAMLLGIVTWFVSGEPVPAVVPAVLAFAIALASLPNDDQLDALRS